MAPKRRSARTRSAAAPPRLQATLSFSGKKGGITKPNVARGNKKDPALVEDLVKESRIEKPDSSLDNSLEEAATPAGSQNENIHAQDPLTDRSRVKTEDVLGGRAPETELGAVGGLGSGWAGDEQNMARKITDVQIKRYWREKEQKRLAPRVHQEDLTVYEKILREWDISNHYGPCIGIARLKRWKRANLLGLNPPMEVLAVILKEMDGGSKNVQRAYVDELMSSRFVET